MLGVFPQDEFALFEPPQWTVVASDPALPVNIVPIDPTRMVIILSPFNAVTPVISIGAANTGGAGMILNGNFQGPLVLNYNTHGPIVQYDYWLQPTAGISLYCVTMSLRRNPSQYGYRDVFKKPVALPVQAQQQAHGASGVASNGKSRLPGGLLRALQERLPGIFGKVE